MAKTSSNVSSILESIVGCKWSLHILGVIRKGILRPGEIKRTADGLTTKVMNERLVKMQNFGILNKKIYPILPLKVEYHLTPFGQKFIQLLGHVEKLERTLARGRTRDRRDSGTGG